MAWLRQKFFLKKYRGVDCRDIWYIGTETCMPFEPLRHRLLAVIRSLFCDIDYLELCQCCRYFDDKSFFPYDACRDGLSFDWCVDQRSYGRIGAWWYSKCGKEGRWFRPNMSGEGNGTDASELSEVD
jgi:hypothetical protein